MSDLTEGTVYPEDPRTAVKVYAADLREDAKAADVFAGMAADSGEECVAAWLRGCSEGLRLASMRTWTLNPEMLNDPSA